MIAVLNHGIDGYRLLLDGLGPNALARFDADVIAQAGVQHLVVLEGINDIGISTRTGHATAAQHQQLVNDIVAAYEQIVARAHTHGIKVAGGTLLPFVGSSFYSTGRGQECLMRTPMRRFGEPAELVGATVFLASPAASFVIGHLLVVDGGFLASGMNQ